MGVVKNHGQCRSDLECVFGSGELIGTCQVKSKHKKKLCFTSKLCVIYPSIIRQLFSELNQILFISILEQQDDCRMFNDEGKLDRYSNNYVSMLLFLFIFYFKKLELQVNTSFFPT